MNTKEFIEKVKDLGYDIKISSEDVIIKQNGCIFAMISRTSPYTMSSYTVFGVKHADELLDLCVKYVKTPIEEREREEEKKYYLKILDSASAIMGRYLNYDKSLDTYFMHNNFQFSDYQTRFTQKEIDEIKKELDTDLAEFEQIEVEEWKQRNL